MSAKFFAAELLPPQTTLESASAYSYARDFLDNRFVYVVISPRAHGLSIGVNMNPDGLCNFDCVYCEVNRHCHRPDRELDLSVMAVELEKTLLLVSSGQLRQLSRYERLSDDLLQLRHVALSGDGEPTLNPDFSRAVQTVVHVRALQLGPFFKLVLVTNGTGLDAPKVRDGLRYLTREDEVWVKLDAGTQAHMDRINRSQVSLDKVLKNTLNLGRQRPIIIQSLFPLLDGEEPPAEEIESFIQRLNELKDGGAWISLVQIYSATRPMANAACGHLSLKTLSRIGRRVRAETGLKTEVF